MNTNKFTKLSLLLALAVTLNIVESFIPLFNGIIPGLKIGLANIITLFVLINYSFKDAIYIGILRVFLVAILRTGLFNTIFFFSLSGTILSIIMMWWGLKGLKLSIIGTSILGSIAHCLGQILIALLIFRNLSMIYYLPWLLLFAIPTGFLTGKICQGLVNHFKNELNENKI